MSVVAMDERPITQGTADDRTTFTHPDGRVWTPEEWGAIGSELEKMNTAAMLLLSRIDHDLSVQQDILRELRLCASILQDSNERARRNKEVVAQRVHWKYSTRSGSLTVF